MVRLHAYDETNRRARRPVGVQTNQFSGAVDPAPDFLAAGLPAGNQQHTAARTIGWWQMGTIPRQHIQLLPALAWLPVLVFGPFAFALFDAIHT